MITFQSHNIDIPSFDIDKVSKWIGEIAAFYGKSVRNLNYLFCDDNYILEQNIAFLGHDFYTDIITFDYTHADKISGDILISIDTVKSNALKFNVNVDDELLRVIIHGVLHLCGIDDKGPGQREIMEMAENKALEIYYNSLSN